MGYFADIEYLEKDYIDKMKKDNGNNITRCLICKKSLAGIGKTGHKRKYCSPECNTAAFNNRKK